MEELLHRSKQERRKSKLSRFEIAALLGMSPDNRRNFMEYITLNDEQKKAMVNSRIEQYEREHYNLAVTKQLADSAALSSSDEATKNDFQNQSDQASQRLAVLEGLVNEAKGLFDALDKPAKSKS